MGKLRSRLPLLKTIWILAAGTLIALSSLLSWMFHVPAASSQREGYIVSGQVLDPQGQPVAEAHIQAIFPGEKDALAETSRQEDGSWNLILPGLTTQEYLEGMMEEVAGETGVEFVLAQSGEVAGTYRSE